MNGGIADQPLARALLRHLVVSRGDDDPLGSFARTVLSGDTMRAAAANPWHGEGLAAAFEVAQRQRAEQTDEQHAEYERQAEFLRRDRDTDDAGDDR